MFSITPYKSFFKSNVYTILIAVEKRGIGEVLQGKRVLEAFLSPPLTAIIPSCSHFAMLPKEATADLMCAPPLN